MRAFDLDRSAAEIEAAVKEMEAQPSPSPEFTQSMEWIKLRAEGGLVVPIPGGYRFTVKGETYVDIPHEMMLEGVASVEAATFRHLATWHEMIADAYRQAYGGEPYKR